MKRFITLTLAGALALSLTACGGGSSTEKKGEVNVYNWGEYIDESIFSDFTAQTGITVNYQTYDSNESLYGKLAGGATGYDVIIDRKSVV